MDKPEVCVMATQLKLDPDAVVGKLVRLWSWAEVSRINANAMSITLEFLDKLVGKKGFGAALMKAGWLREVDGVMQFPNFGRHNGPAGKGRALTAQRVSRHRERKRTSDESDENVEGVSVTNDSGAEEVVTPKVKAVNQRRNTVKELLKSDLSEENTPMSEIHSGAILPDDIELEPPFDDLDSESITIEGGGFEASEADEESPFEDESPFGDAVEFGGEVEEEPVVVVEEVSAHEPTEGGAVVQVGEEEEVTVAVEGTEVDPAPKVKKARGGRKSGGADSSDQPMLF
ncbi:MAG: hypothetical protein QE274_12735 [Verrucomicrobiaceae bacterium]|nr:hypothetical protein [Verrucomicrobiaceae bacterium]